VTTSAVTEAPNTVSDEENRIDNINLDENKLGKLTIGHVHREIVPLLLIG
jgi:hypothetical protein